MDGLRKVVDSIVPLARHGYKVVLTVKGVIPKANDKVVKVVISQWNPLEQVGFPLSMLPSKLHRHLKIGAFLLATVNTAAESSDDLFFEDFDVPHSDDVKSVLAQFGGR